MASKEIKVVYTLMLKYLYKVDHFRLNHNYDYMNINTSVSFYLKPVIKYEDHYAVFIEAGNWKIERRSPPSSFFYCNTAGDL